jgi:hypothetical protein
VISSAPSAVLRPRAVLALCALALVALPAPLAAAAAPASALDARSWELVSPPAKSGGEVGTPGTGDAGVLQAAAAGSALAFGSEASFGEAAGAAPVSQYLTQRRVGGWGTANLTPPLLSNTYAGGAYQLFSADLARALLTSGWSCRDGSAECAAENPPLGAGAPAGYRNLYLREGATFTPVLRTANAPWLSAPADQFHLALEGATPDLRHVVLAAESNLYEWEDGTLEQLNTAPGASLAAPAGAISADGSRVYWSQGANLYLREGPATKQVDESVGGGGSFETASADGSVAFFTKAGHLYRYDAAGEQASDLSPGGEVEGVLGASGDGSYLYYLTAAGVYLYHGGASVKVAAAADAGNTPPATGTARLSADGTRLAFLSQASLTGYANVGKTEVFVYDAVAKKLLCASCNPQGSTPAGPSTIPGAIATGEGPAAYKPRALSADGGRLFFTSGDALIGEDTDKRPDVYEWQAKGVGGCTRTLGCIGLISGGRAGSATFADASASGDDAFFATTAALLPADTGSEDLDLYDARAGGGFPEPTPPIPCVGDACQGPAPAPEDPTPGSATFSGAGNPPVRFAKPHQPKKHHRKRHHRKKHRHHPDRRGGRR